MKTIALTIFFITIGGLGLFYLVLIGFSVFIMLFKKEPKEDERINKSAFYRRN